MTESFDPDAFVRQRLLDRQRKQPGTREVVAPDENSPPGYRSTDPSTSSAGARDAYGRTGTHRHAAFTAIADSPHGLTWDEVWVKTGIDGIWKRLSDLKNEGWIEAHGSRLCEATGSEGAVYILTAQGREWLAHRRGTLGR